MNHALIYPFELGLVVIVHAEGAVWTRYYSCDLQAISDLFYVELLKDSDSESFFGEFVLPDRFDTAPLIEAGFCRSSPRRHSGQHLTALRQVEDLAA